MERKLVGNVQQYIQQFPLKTQAVLKKIRRIIKEAAPQAQETISYRIPTYKLNGTYVIYFAGFANHVSLYPFLETMGPALEKYRSGRGTIRLPLDKPLPVNLIRKAIKVNLKNNLMRNEMRQNRKKILTKSKKK